MCFLLGTGIMILIAAVHLFVALEAGPVAIAEDTTNAPFNGQEGVLMFYIRYGYNIPTAGESDAFYVRIEAVSSNGSVHTKLTTTQSTRNPVWNEELFFSPREWQSFRIRVLSSDGTPAGPLVTVPLLEQSRTIDRVKHCIDADCNGYVMYNYKVLKSVRGQLQIRLRQKAGKRRPGSSPKTSVTVSTMTPSGSFTSHTLKKANTWINIRGCSFTNLIKVGINTITTNSVVQTDTQFIDISPGLFTYCLPDVSFICRTFAPQRLEIRFTPDSNDCDLNPCLNGGTCIDDCGRDHCLCTSSFTGSLCQYKISD